MPGACLLNSWEKTLWDFLKRRLWSDLGGASQFHWYCAFQPTRRKKVWQDKPWLELHSKNINQDLSFFISSLLIRITSPLLFTWVSCAGVQGGNRSRNTKCHEISFILSVLQLIHHLAYSTMVSNSLVCSVLLIYPSVYQTQSLSETVELGQDHLVHISSMQLKISHILLQTR